MRASADSLASVRARQQESLLRTQEELRRKREAAEAEERERRAAKAAEASAASAQRQPGGTPYPSHRFTCHILYYRTQSRPNAITVSFCAIPVSYVSHGGWPLTQSQTSPRLMCERRRVCSGDSRGCKEKGRRGGQPACMGRTCLPRG